MSQTNGYFNNMPFAKYPYGQQVPTQQMVMGLKGRPVSSLEEVRATGIDFDGSVFFFPDLPNKRIYTKQINVDGTATLNMYELKEIPQETPNAFVTREEFEKAFMEIQNIIQAMIVPPPQEPQNKAPIF